MVVQSMEFKNLNKSNQRLWCVERQRAWLGSMLGCLLFMTIYILGNCVWQKLVTNRNDTIISGLSYKNYENLYKMYNNSLEGNIKKNIFNSVKTEDNIHREVSNTFRVVCYYVTSSNTTRSRQLSPNSIDPYLCTHVIVGFACIENGTLQPQQPADKVIYDTVVGLKKNNPSLKVLLSVEGFSSTGEFAQVVSSHELRIKFAQNTLTFLNSSGFDGVDLDWEFPSWPNENLLQVRNYSLLLGVFRQLMISNYNLTGKNFILSVAVAAPDLIIRQSYEINEIAAQVDFINLMSYDYHMFSQYLPLTGPNAPLYQRSADAGYMVTLNTNWSATHWAAWGMPLSKINVGIPTYGHSFRLVNEDNNGWNAPSSGFGKTGAGNGFLSYSEACIFIKNPTTTHVFDDEYDVPYAYNGDEWISYDNPISIQFKAMYVKDNQFGGAMIYSLNCDDFDGVCSPQKFPLTRIVSNILTS